MRPRIFNFVAVISLVLAVSLLTGFFGTIEFGISHVSVTQSRVVDRLLTVGVDRGRVKTYWFSHTSVFTRPVNEPSGFRFERYTRIWPPRHPEIRRSIWEFDAHPLRSGRRPTQEFIVACPIWCMMVLLLIAPTIWFRKWRRGKSLPEGFSVQPRPAILASS